MISRKKLDHIRQMAAECLDPVHARDGYKAVMSYEPLCNVVMAELSGILEAAHYGLGAMTERSSAINIARTRDILLPAANAIFARAGLRYEIEISPTSDSLVVRAWRLGVRPLSFDVTYEEIADNVYQNTFGPLCKELRDQLLAIPAGRAA